jgi:hypothetical protein
MGVLGPAIAFNLPANVSFNNLAPGQGEVNATLSNQDVVAGFGCGLAAGAGFSLLQQFYLPENWFSPWKFAWKTALNLSLDFNIDVVQVLLHLIEILIGRQNKARKILNKTKAKFDKYLQNGRVACQGFSFWGTSAGFGPEKTTTATAKWTLPIDFLSFVPPFYAFTQAASKIRIYAQFGTELTVNMPVTLSLDSFDVTGGLQNPKDIARYGPITYDNSTAKAKGQPFFSGSKPTRLTTNVSYTTSFTITLQFFAKLEICKLFSKAVTTRSFDLLELMRLPRVGTEVIPGSVSTSIESGCVLIPQMTITFISGADPQFHLPANTVVTEVQFKGLIALSEPWQGKEKTEILIETNPPVDGFPTSTTISPGSESASFAYTFPNNPVPTGDPNKPDVSPSLASPYATYLVTAYIKPNDSQPCDDWQATVPVMVQNRSLITGFQAGTQVNGPPDNLAAGAELNADQSKNPGKAVASYVVAKYEFPYAEGSAVPNGVEMKVYLLDANRNPHNGSDVVVTFLESGAIAHLSRPDTVTVPLDRSGNSFKLEWRSTGPETNYSSLFFLIMDAGSIYGQSEFWLRVWNWS